MKIKRLLFLTHRWFGIFLCMMFFLWFASGIVMMYVEYPELTEKERIDALPPLSTETIKLDINSLSQSIPTEAVIDSISISSLLNRPIYHVEYNSGEYLSVFADNGEQVKETTVSTAEMTASIFSENLKLGGTAKYLEKMEMDQWTVYGGFNEHRPLHKVALNNDAGTIVYISNYTGQVLRDTHAWERAWNWVGSTIHWIYPMQLRKHSNAWVNVVIIMSSLGIIAVISGTVVGFLRLRLKRRYKNGTTTPYSGIQKWHHLLGMFFALFVTMFIVSGLFSMNPFGMFDDKSSSLSQIQRYQGQSLNLTNLQTELDNTLSKIDSSSKIKELSWHNIGDQGVLVAHTRTGRNAINLRTEQLETTIKNSIPLLIPDYPTVEVEKLEEFDNHYYSTHNRYRPLPAYRARFSDEESTWYYINARTGELLSRSTRINRIQRWLYNGLHSLDFQILLAYRPLWDVVVIFLSLAGLALSYTSIVIAWRRLRKTKFVKKSDSIKNKFNHQWKPL